MTDLVALRDAILANPDDDTVRLVYADHLEEVGQEVYAAFIRTQIEVARTDIQEFVVANNYDEFCRWRRVHRPNDRRVKLSTSIT